MASPGPWHWRALGETRAELPLGRPEPLAKILGLSPRGLRVCGHAEEQGAADCNASGTANEAALDLHGFPPVG